MHDVKVKLIATNRSMTKLMFTMLYILIMILIDVFKNFEFDFKHVIYFILGLYIDPSSMHEL